MGLFDVFSKGGKYFGKAIEPRCEYCEFGKRTRDGDKVLCTKKGMVDASFHCPKFVYSPLKRIPVKQMKLVGFLEGNYDDKSDDDGKHGSAPGKKPEGSASATEKKPDSSEEEKPAPAAKPESAAAEKPAPAAKPESTAEEKPAPAAKPANTAEEKPAPAAKPESTAAEKPAPAAKPESPAAPAPAPKPVPTIAGASDLAALAAAADAAGSYIPDADASDEAPADNTTGLTDM